MVGVHCVMSCRVVVVSSKKRKIDSKNSWTLFFANHGCLIKRRPRLYTGGCVVYVTWWKEHVEKTRVERWLQSIPRSLTQPDKFCGNCRGHRHGWTNKRQACLESERRKQGRSNHSHGGVATATGAAVVVVIVVGIVGGCWVSKWVTRVGYHNVLNNKA